MYPWICLPPAWQSLLLFFRVPSAVDYSNTWKIAPTKPWVDLLLRRSLDNLLLKRARDNWSEYSLYYLLAEHNKVLFDYHFLPSSKDATRLHCQSSVWTNAQFAGWDPKYCFDRDTAGLFLIVQSSSTISLELICRRLNPHLPITRPVTASLTHRLRSLWEDIRTVDGLFSSASLEAKGNMVRRRKLRSE